MESSSNDIARLSQRKQSWIEMRIRLPKNVCFMIPDELDWLQDSVSSVCDLFQMAYAFGIFTIFIVSMGNKPNAAEKVFKFLMLFFGFIMAMTFVISVSLLMSGGTNFLKGIKGNSDQGLMSNILGLPIPSIYLFLAGMVLYPLAGLMHGEALHICVSIGHYFFVLPTFVNILGVYSYCNLQDLSWGTKGLESGGGHGAAKVLKNGSYKDVKEQRKAEEAAKKAAAAEEEETKNVFAAFRSQVLLSWVFLNGAFTYLVVTFNGNRWFLTFIVFMVAVMNLFKFTLSTWFIVSRQLRGGKGRAAYQLSKSSGKKDSLSANLLDQAETGAAGGQEMSALQTQTLYSEL